MVLFPNLHIYKCMHFFYRTEVDISESYYGGYDHDETAIGWSCVEESKLNSTGHIEMEPV